MQFDRRIPPVAILTLLSFLGIGCSKDKPLADVVVDTDPGTDTRLPNDDSPESPTNGPINPVPFPSGFDYPQTAATIQGWVTQGNTDTGGPPERKHGFNLWAGLNQPTPTGDPVWRTWYTTTQTFGDTHVDEKCNKPTSLNALNLSNAPTDGDRPINYPDAPVYPVPDQVKTKYPKCYCENLDMLVDGPTFQNNGDIMVAGVMYNEAAYQWITSQKLNLSTTLNKLKPANATDPATDMPPMPEGSIVLKVMQWPVQSEGLTVLPIWDSQTKFDADYNPAAGKYQYAGYERPGLNIPGNTLWTKAVAISVNGTLNGPLTYLHGVWTGENGKKVDPIEPITYQQADLTVTPITNFYHKQYSQEDLDKMDDCDRAILDASAYWAYNRAFEANDYLVTIAMHIMTKEQPIWTFQSAWWSDTPTQSRFAKARPELPNATGPWDQYLLTTAYGQKQKPGQNWSYANWPNKLPEDASAWPVAFNPYIELAAAHPIATNCMNCHHRAAWPNRFHKLAVEGSYLAQGKPPGALEIFNNLKDNSILPTYGKTFDGLLITDSQWSLSDRAHAPKPED